MNKYNHLFEPFTFKNGVSLKNRIVQAPITTASSNDDYTISDEEIEYYNRRAQGPGMVITGCTYVLPNGIGGPNIFAGYADSFTPSLRKLANAAKSGGARAILQVYHAGDKAIADLIPNGDVVSPSGVSPDGVGVDDGSYTPSTSSRALTDNEIVEIIHAFGETTRRAIEAGFDGIELHGAHGFLLQNFLSPYFNRRQDQWGGTLENRLRMPLAVIREVKKTVDQYAKTPFILGYRISPEEHQEGALRIEDSFALIDQIIKENVDYLHVSLVDVNTSKPRYGQVDGKTHLELVVDHVKGQIPVIAAGGLENMESISLAISKGLTLAAVGKSLISDPDWVQKVETGREAEIKTVIKASEVKEIALPTKLWGILPLTGAFKIEQ